MGPEDTEQEDTRSDEQKAADAERVQPQHTTTERVDGPKEDEHDD